jgi:hypothetical protein
MPWRGAAERGGNMRQGEVNAAAYGGFGKEAYGDGCGVKGKTGAWRLCVLPGIRYCPAGIVYLP